MSGKSRQLLTALHIHARREFRRFKRANVIHSIKFANVVEAALHDVPFEEDIVNRNETLFI